MSYRSKIYIAVRNVMPYCVEIYRLKMCEAKGLSVRGRRHPGHTVWTQSQRHGDHVTGRRAGGISRHLQGGYGRAFKP